MMQNLLLTRLANGLTRKSIQSCSRWALAYRVMGKPYPGPWTFKHHPWSREVHDSTAELNVIQKASQMGFTEAALNRVFYMMDVHRTDCLYLLPAWYPDARDFSSGRFDPAIESSPHLKLLFSNVKNVGHKRAGIVNLYIRGTHGKSGLKSVPVGYITLDELDEMEEGNIPLALERMSGQLDKRCDMISTPTVDDHGINAFFKLSTQEKFVFPCPRCSKITDLTFPECLVITGNNLNDPNLENSHLICKECKGVLKHESKEEWLGAGFWVPTNKNGHGRGFSVNHLYSSTVRPQDIARKYLKAQISQSDEQEFYNSGLGVPHIVAGACITPEQLVAARRSYHSTEVAARNNKRIRTIGIDIGKWNHIEVVEWIFEGTPSYDLNLFATAKVLLATKVPRFEDIDTIIKQYQVDCGVVDAAPERRLSKELCDRFPGRMFMCIYSNSSRGKDIKKSADTYDPQILVDRTYWLDLSQGRFLKGNITLPRDIPQEYEDQVSRLVKRYVKDKNGNPAATYLTRGHDDHYAHARNYSEIALPLAASVAYNQDIGKFL